MRVVVQRVRHASVGIGGREKSRIGKGLLLLVGICDEDTKEDIDYLCRKIVQMRIFDDEQGVMNKSIMDIEEVGIMVVSQFTLMASTRKGNRPSYLYASKPDTAVPMYEAFTQRLQEIFGHPIATGVFGADMQVELLNDGPVTIIMDSKMRDKF